MRSVPCSLAVLPEEWERRLSVVTCPSCSTETSPHAQFCGACGNALPREQEGDPYLGQVVARKYRVEKLLGEGGMGRVYRANQLVLEKPVVLKLLHPTLQKDARTVARFQREAKAASRLNHPNSIDVLDFGQTDDGALFIAMEFVDGRDLHQVLTADWPLSEPRVIRIVTQVLSALADAHQAGVIHRDLKPENVMVMARRGGESDVVKVLDFGIAKIVDGTSEEGPSLTRTGFVCGTPEYMSPEQARGSPLDARSDLYSVGVLLYQMVTRQLPFSSNSAMGFATKHLTEEPKPPNELRPGSCSRELEALILWALRKEAADRPQTAVAFLDSLNLLPAAEAVHAPRTARVPIPLGMVGSTDDALGLAPTVASRGRRGSSGRGLQIGLGALVLLAAAGAGVLAFKPLSDTPGRPTMSAPAAASVIPVWAREVPADKRDPARASALVQDGDNLYLGGDRVLARSKYLEAFEADPTAALALKLGMLARLRGGEGEAEARGFFGRALKESPASPARALIHEWYPDVEQAVSTR
jgi:tRNA A-37 threonylcarbamoyl transferase component Bud32